MEIVCLVPVVPMVLSFLILRIGWPAKKPRIYNDDGEIDEEDFKLFVDRLFDGPSRRSFSFPILRIGWPAKKPMTINDDGEIDEEDFKLFVDRLFEGPDGPDGPVLSFPILRIG